MKRKIKHLLLFLSIILVASCESSDSNSSDECNTTPTDQIAKGSFYGSPFVSPGGSYRIFNTGSEIKYLCTINVEADSDNDCSTSEDKTILFSLSKLEAQTIKVSDIVDSQIKPTLNFNYITINEGTLADLACGILIIKEYNSTTKQIKGSVNATSTDGSTIDGNFTLELCDN